MDSMMNNVSEVLSEAMEELIWRINFHDFFGLRVVERAIVYGFVQAWDIKQQNTFEPLTSGALRFVRYFEKSVNK